MGFIPFILLFRTGGNLDPLSECVLQTKDEPYTGTVSVTNNGIPCQAWASSSPHSHKYNENRYFPADGSVQAAKNYCRSIKAAENGFPFCYTTNPDVRRGRCTLQICNGKEKKIACRHCSMKVIYLHYCTHHHEKPIKKALKLSIKFNSIFKDSYHGNFIKKGLKYLVKCYTLRGINTASKCH